MLHLGLSIQNIYQNNKIKTQIANAIRKLEVTSRIIHKQKYPVNGDISTTNMHVYNSSKGLAVDTIYEVLCQTIKDILDKTATYRKTNDSSNVGLTNTVDKYHLLQQLYATRMSLIGELDNAKKTVANLEAQLAANAEEIKRHR